LRVPQDRSGQFSTELFERYQRSERALVAALAEMHNDNPLTLAIGVPTRLHLPLDMHFPSLREVLAADLGEPPDRADLLRDVLVDLEALAYATSRRRRAFHHGELSFHGHRWRTRIPSRDFAA
jgi:hypothetical protein